MVRVKNKIFCEMNTFHSFMNSPVGPLEVSSTETDIIEIKFSQDFRISNQQIPGILKECIKQLDLYFSGVLKEFNLPLKPTGTDFQQRVWQKLRSIPFGSTISYLELAQSLGDQKAIRAVAAANGRNRIPVIIPCHRVIGSNGSLVGFAGGLANKEWLLHHEGALSQTSLFHSC
ncbi:MAG: methylated-DNA--protein-cysteine methyltransferase [Cyclobacteriaceae bacterium]|nr:MAG: methylated-DNA--protein-cysteine methyltransferase [Cyclobacteriaceae bacterium]